MTRSIRPDQLSKRYDCADLLSAGISAAETYGGEYDQGHTDNDLSLRFSGPAALGGQEYIEIADGVFLVICDQRVIHPMEFNFEGAPVLGLSFRLSGSTHDCYENRPDIISKAGDISVVLQNRPMRWERRVQSGQRLYAAFIVGKIESVLSFMGLDYQDLPSALLLDQKPRDFAYSSAPMPQEALRAVTNLQDTKFTGPLRRAYLQAKVKELVCTAFGRINEFPSPDATSTPRYLSNLADAREIIISELHAPHTLESLSRRVGLSRTMFACTFKEHFGVTVFEFITQHRMRKAEELLARPGMTLQKVAEIIGYDNAYSFSRAYKRWTKSKLMISDS